MKKWILPILMAGFLLTGCSSPAATSSALPSSTEKITETQMTEEPGTLEETETGTATETQQEPVIQTVKITATGDCTLGATQTHGYAGSFHEYYDKYGQDYFFKNVRSIFEQDDFTLINLECVVKCDRACGKNVELKRKTGVCWYYDRQFCGGGKSGK